jgi:hypothetical protein
LGFDERRTSHFLNPIRGIEQRLQLNGDFGMVPQKLFAIYHLATIVESQKLQKRLV